MNHGRVQQTKIQASWKKRTQKWRRRHVIGIYLLALLIAPMRLGEDHHLFRHFHFSIYPIFIAFVGVRNWYLGQRRIVTSLDDRAQLAHGVNFDELSAEEQKYLLRKYRVGSYLLPVDERQQAFRLEAKGKAYRFLQTALPWFVAVYWALYLWIPAGRLRDALMDSPMIVSWLAVLIVTLPSAIEMWTEPDEIGEPRALSGPSSSLIV